MANLILSLALDYEDDVVAARQRARQIASSLGFDERDQTRVATAVSEIARNAFVYGREGKVEFSLDERADEPVLLIRVSDKGQGIAALREVLGGQYQSKTGLGKGIIGARRLMDEFQVESRPGDTVVLLGKRLPSSVLPPSKAAIARITKQVSSRQPEGPWWELRQQNHELLRALDELRARHEELDRVNSELEDTNRGVVALYSELDDKAEQLKRADALKSRFLSYVSHEFRAPLNSIVSLARILLDRTDGDLAPEQEKQVGYIEQSALELSELVNDLLDLTRVEAGKIVVRPTFFEVRTLFGMLREVMRPLVVNPLVSLIFEEPAGVPTMQTDEAKVAQILRNFLSNALKFTECGEVRVSASLASSGHEVVFAVADTGIGIAPEHHKRIFEDFTQVENPIQRRVKGVGIGLPLSKKFAELLGGGVSVESKLGVGSVFRATVPIVYAGAGWPLVTAAGGRAAAASGAPAPSLLIVDDEEVDRYLIRGLLQGAPYSILEASDGWEALRLARENHPQAIFLDLVMPEMDGFQVLERLKADSATRDIPVIVVTAKALEDEESATLRALAAAVVSKAAASRADATKNIRQTLEKALAEHKELGKGS